jgi:TRAP-type C4-dicarboxylate transport system permease small subunit
MPSTTARARRILNRCTLVGLIAAAHFAVLTGVAWAKPHKEAAAEVQSKSYVLPYAVVVLGIGLGVIVVLRPVKRDDEPKQQIKPD